MLDLAVALGVAALVVGVPPLIEIARRCLRRLFRGPSGDVNALQKRVQDTQSILDNLLSVLDASEDHQSLPGLKDVQASIKTLKERLCLLQARVDRWCLGKTWPRVAYLAFWNSDVKEISTLIRELNDNLDKLERRLCVVLTSSHVSEVHPRTSSATRSIGGGLPHQWFRLPTFARNPYQRLGTA
ncbi:hypothetical protein C2E23DRAFT_885756 [Lenzites betulinus]|nr:hypothetical protein C2E23DRAFT_885756 [Lenzites betulinus]